MILSTCVTVPEESFQQKENVREETLNPGLRQTSLLFGKKVMSDLRMNE